jgi:hypothetical protein
MRTTRFRVRPYTVALVLIAAAFTAAGSAGAQTGALDGMHQGAGFAPCVFNGGGPPPIDSCTNTEPTVVANCDPAGDSTLSYSTDTGYIPGSPGGRFSETVTATIGPQDGPPATAFQPFADNGSQAGSIGLPTGRLLDFQASFTIYTNDGRTITGTMSLVSDLANTGVCLNLNDQKPPSDAFDASMTGYFYIVNAQVLSYQATISDASGSTQDSGVAEAYLINTFGTYTFDPTIVATNGGAYLGGFGTTHPATGATTSAPTSAGTNIDVVPAPGVDVTFSNVTGDGTTSVTEISQVPALPAGFQIGDPPLYYDLSTTATFSGSATVCVPYGFAPAGTTPKLLHYDGGAWVDVTTTFDDLTRIVCGSVTSFSPFAAVFAPTGPVTTSDCKHGGWQRYTNPSFKNEGDCVSYVATKGKH